MCRRLELYGLSIVVRTQFAQSNVASNQLFRCESIVRHANHQLSPSRAIVFGIYHQPMSNERQKHSHQSSCQVLAAYPESCLNDRCSCANHHAVCIAANQLCTGDSGSRTIQLWHLARQARPHKAHLPDRTYCESHRGCD